jgi:membrane protease subunit HflC
MSSVSPAASRSFVLSSSLIVGYSSLFTVYQTEQALVVRLGEPVRVVTEPGPELQGAVHRQRDLDRQAHPRSGKPAQEVIASDQKRLVVDAFARYRIKDALRFYQSVGSIQGANSQLSTLLNAALRRVLGEATLHPCGARRARSS